MNSWRFLILLSGLLMGLFGVLLTVWGNPENSGICISCFMETSAGALGLHPNERMQYLRPELAGFVLGAFGSALLAGEYRSRGGSVPLFRFASGIILIIGCAVFIGCPIKLFLRLTAGDLSSLAGVFGLIAGVWLGVSTHRHGLELPTPQPERGGSGLIVPLMALMLLALYLLRPSFLRFSTGGGGVAAPWLLSLTVALLIGFISQRSRFCITGSVRDMLLMGIRSPMAGGFLLFIISGSLTAFLTGRFHPAFYGQPGAHTEVFWSFLGMLLVGWVSTLIGGCPFRQLVKAGEGDADAGLVVIGMLSGGAIVQSFGIAATAAGVPLYGKLALLLSLSGTILAVRCLRRAPAL